MVNKKTLAKISQEYLQEIQDFLVLTNCDSDITEDCESPIEQLLTISLNNFFIGINNFLTTIDVYIDVQKKIKCGSSVYRADILLTLEDFTNEKNSLFVIECDGHEFHEKTKEQVKRDRERERKLMKEGFTVIRFSGSEIVSDPSGCAKEVWEIVRRNIHDKRNYLEFNKE